MSYISKDTIKKAYKSLSGLTQTPNTQGQTTAVSSLRYICALNMYHKKYNKDCDTKVKEDRDEFAKLVGDVVRIDESGNYVVNFYNEIKNSADFKVGSNFYSAGVVNDSKVNPVIDFTYPKSKGEPLFKVKNGVLFDVRDFYKNINAILPDDSLKCGLCVWLLRYKDIQSFEYESVRTYLLQLFDDVFCSHLMPSNLKWNEYIKNEVLESQCANITPSDLIVSYTHQNSTIPSNNIPVLKNSIDITLALKTKPFLLLAGISGTGKSQKVKELAYASCPNDKELRSDDTKPGNYCLIEVKPNWHDSTELLGYWSNLSQKYMLTDFIRFAYKAAKHPNVPFFLCLDEMNLAPVEQYFAEYLSVLESRKVVNGKIVTEPLITKDIFRNCKLNDENNNNKYIYTDIDAAIIQELQKDGLRLPDNLFVIGTVNMDDTTHQFSRKVIDRAFTIEMNGGKLEDMFSDENKMKLEYRPNGQEAKLELFKSKYTKAVEAIESDKAKPFADVIKAEVPKLLNAVNNILAKTPFRVSYRVQNEMVLYICNVIENATEDIDINAVIGTAFLATLLEKILPRVQGDERLLKTAEGNVFTDLKKYVEQMQNVENTEEGETNFKALVIAKLDEMNDRLTKSYFASFFG